MDSLQEALSQEYGGRAVLVPNGCDISEFLPDPTLPRGKTVLTVTRLTNKQKRTGDLICAMAWLSEEWTLDIVRNRARQGSNGSLATETQSLVVRHISWICWSRPGSRFFSTLWLCDAIGQRSCRAAVLEAMRRSVVLSKFGLSNRA
jgi:hypothetical protein